jgi:hypothetical protein
LEITLPAIEVTNHRRMNSGAWTVDVRFPTNVGTVRLYFVYAKRRADGSLTVKPPAIRYGEIVHGTVGLDNTLWQAIVERVTVTVTRAERKAREDAERLLGSDVS